MTSIIGNIFTILLLVVAIILIFFLTKSKFNSKEIPSVMGYKLMAVLSGSMRPQLEPGDLILTRPKDVQKIQKGDIVTYQTNQGTFVTHRITYIDKKSGELMFKTKGDANNVEDEGVVLQNRLIGSMVLRIPYGGYIAKFIRTPLGLFILVFLFSSIITVGEIKKAVSKQKGELQKAERGK